VPLAVCCGEKPSVPLCPCNVKFQFLLSQVLSRGKKDGYNTAKVDWIKDHSVSEEEAGNTEINYYATS
jgi:hypothetical protein